MNVAAIVLASVLALACLAAGSMKVLSLAPAKADADRFGMSYGTYKVIGLLEAAAGIGLAIGVFVADFWWIGVAAAVGLVALTTGALITHVRAGDPAAKAAGAPIFGVLAAVAGILIYLNAA